MKNINDTLDRIDNKLDILNKLMVTIGELKDYKTAGYADDGLHKGLPVGYWEARLSRDKEVCAKHPKMCRFVAEARAALKSAIAFRDGDAEGYRAMHGGV